jgi:hypothetical protein
LGHLGKLPDINFSLSIRVVWTIPTKILLRRKKIK